jgi:hypothetical protein
MPEPNPHNVPKMPQAEAGEVIETFPLQFAYKTFAERI